MKAYLSFFCILLLFCTEQNLSSEYISVEAIKQTLDKPVKVGFDIDDTVVFSSVQMQAFAKRFPNYQNPMLVPERYEFINCDMLDYLLVKEGIKPVIEMHQKRGDEIYFITARKTADCVKKGDYSLKNYLSEAFSISNMHDVVYAGPSLTSNSKTSWIEKMDLKIYYGDDDKDIEAALEANIQGIRVLRPKIASKKTGYRVGYYDEPILIDSDF